LLAGRRDKLPGAEHDRSRARNRQRDHASRRRIGQALALPEMRWRGGAKTAAAERGIYAASPSVGIAACAHRGLGRPAPETAPPQAAGLDIS